MPVTGRALPGGVNALGSSSNRWIEAWIETLDATTITGITAGSIPSLDAAKVSTGVFPPERLGTDAIGAGLRFLSDDGTFKVPPSATGVGGGTVTSVGANSLSAELVASVDNSTTTPLINLSLDGVLTLTNALSELTGVAAAARANLGLGNVDDTADIDKPISNDQAAALYLKANDNNVMHLTGSENISGTKQFQGIVADSTAIFNYMEIRPSAAPSSSVWAGSWRLYTSSTDQLIHAKKSDGTDQIVRTNIFGASGPSHSAGLVPDPGSSAGTTRFLREDGTFAAPTGGGTVTSVGVALPSQTFSVTGSPVTGSGTLTAAYKTQPAKTVLIGPISGADATPTHRLLTMTDLPTITSVGLITSGIWNGTAIADSYIASAATWNAKAADNAVVHNTGDESITGIKSFQYIATSGYVDVGTHLELSPTTEPAASSSAGSNRLYTNSSDNRLHLKDSAGVDTALNFTVFSGSGTGHSSGLVPDPGAVAGATRYLREDGAFAVPPGTAGTSGTVTSVGISMPGDYSVSGSPVTGGGTITISRASQVANKFLAGPASGAAAAPAYRAMVAADLPTITALGTVATGTWQATPIANAYIASSTTWNAKENALTFTGPLSRATNTISIPSATTSRDGYLTQADWNTFYSGRVASIGSPSVFGSPITVAPVAGTGGTLAYSIDIIKSDSTHDGYLGSLDWSTFNAKEGSLGNPNVSGKVLSSTTLGVRSWVALPSDMGTPVLPAFINGSGNLAIKQANTSQDGYLTSTNWNTFNNKEDWLGNPTTTTVGDSATKILASTLAGVRKWVTLPLGGTVTSATAPLNISSGVLSMHVADSTHNGYLSSANWSLFNAKISPNTSARLTDLTTTAGGLNATTSGAQAAIVTTQTLTGSVMPPNYSANDIEITSDTLNGGGNFISGFNIRHKFGGTGCTGPRLGLLVSIDDQNGGRDSGSIVSSVAAEFQNTGFRNMGGTDLSSPSTSRGVIHGINPSSNLLGTANGVAGGATNIKHISSAEFNVAVETGASVYYKTIISLAHNATDAVQGSQYDCMAAFVRQAGPGSRVGLLFGDMLAGHPLSADGTIMATTGYDSIATAFDFSSYDFSDAHFKFRSGSLVAGPKTFANSSANRFLKFKDENGATGYIPIYGYTP